LLNEFKFINLHFNIDAIGELDEYIRHGTKWSKVEELNTLPYHILMDNPTWLKINILPNRLKLFTRVKLKQFINGLYQHEGTNIHPHLVEKAEQILSYLNRSISEKEDLLGREVFVKRIKEFEGLRHNKAIEDIVPELKHLFKQ
jgi:hypothetical protein